MAAYKLLDFKDIYEAIAAELKLQLSDTTSMNRIKRVVNMVYLDEVSPRARWFWLQGHSVVRHKITYSSGTCAVLSNTTTVTLSVPPAVTSGDNGSFKGWYFTIDGQNEIYRIAEHAAESGTLTLDTPYNGNPVTANAFKIFQENIPLPIDCRETVEIYYDHLSTPLRGLGLQEFRKTQTSAPKSQGRPAYYCTYDFQDPTDDTVETELDRYRVLKVFPAISSYTTILKVDYIKEVTPLELDGDEPLMPVEDRIVLYYGALSILWSSIGRNPEEAGRNKSLYEDKIARMMGKITDSMDKPRVEPESSYIVAKRGPRVGVYSRKGLGPSTGGSGTYNSPTYLENVTINGATVTGDVLVNPGKTIDGRDISADGLALDTHIASIGDVHGAEGGIVGLNNAQVLTNKTIDAANNTISNISDVNISATANIALNKLSPLTASKVAVTDASGVINTSSITATELGYLSGVTGSVQSQINATATALSNHLTNPTDAHDASAISYTDNGALGFNSNVQDALAFAGDTLSTHLGDTTAHMADAIVSVPFGNLAATDVQQALYELQADVDTRATSSALTTHASASTGVHGVSGSVVGTANTQVLTNKDYDGGTASNSSRLTVPKAAKATLDGLTRKEATLVYASDQDKLYVDDGSVLKEVGSGGSGTINFITNPDGGTGVTGWTEGSYTAATRPSGNFTASSGAGSFAISTTTTTPLGYGTTSFLLTKTTGASRQGRAVETSFALPLSYRAKVLKIEADYIVNSGTFVAGSNTTDSSLIWYCAFSTNGGITYIVAEPSSFKLLSNSTTISDKFSASIQTPSDATNMKLIAYVAESANSAWVVETIVAVSPSNYPTIGLNGPVGSIIATGSLTPPTGYLYANGSAVSRTTYSELFKVIGTTYGTGDGSTTFNLPDLRGVFARGAGSQTIGAETYSATLGQKQNDATAKNGLGITDPGHSHQYDMSGSGNSNSLWHPNPNNGSGSNSFASALYNDAFYGRFSNHIISSGSNVYLNNGDAETCPANVAVAYHICFNAGSVQVSDGYDGRVVVFETNTLNFSATTGTYATPAQVTGLTATIDTVGGFASNSYTIRTAGRYKIGVYGSTGSNAGSKYMRINRDGVSLADIDVVTAAYGTFGLTKAFDLNAGNVITILFGNNTATENWLLRSFTIEKLSGSPVTSATEEFSERYTNASGQSIPNGGTPTLVTGWARTYSSHNTFNPTTGVFTPGIAGRFRFSLNMLMNAASFTSGSVIYASLYKNGSEYSRIAFYPQQTTGTNYIPLIGSDTVDLIGTDTIDVRIAHGESAARSLIVSASYNHLRIEKVK